MISEARGSNWVLGLFSANGEIHDMRRDFEPPFLRLYLVIKVVRLSFAIAEVIDVLFQKRG
jgi:hypothetical protein